MYVPVYAVSVAVVQRSRIFRDPRRVLWRAALGVARSSAFLSAYCSCAWLSTCLLHHIAGQRPITRRTVAACTLLPGLASLIEKPSRRTELAIYCLGLALQSVGRRASRSGNAPRLKRVDAMLISLSSATIMHCYTRHPETFGAKYKNVFDWVFGASEEDERLERMLLYRSVLMHLSTPLVPPAFYRACRLHLQAKVICVAGVLSEMGRADAAQRCENHCAAMCPQCCGSLWLGAAPRSRSIGDDAASLSSS